MTTDKSRNKTHKQITANGSILEKYQRVIVGKEGFLHTLYFEFCTWLSVVPGALGLAIRKLFWPRLFKSCGKGVQFGQGVLLRHPNRISIGDNVIIAENVILDARNHELDLVISIGDGTMIANDVSLSAKGGEIHIGQDCGIGAQTIIQSIVASPVHIGNDCIIGPQCYLIGGGSYDIHDPSLPIRAQGNKPDAGVTLANDVWLGAKVAVIGASMGTRSIAGTHALVNKDVAEQTIVGGVPAKPIGNTPA